MALASRAMPTARRSGAHPEQLEASMRTKLIGLAGVLCLALGCNDATPTATSGARDLTPQASRSRSGQADEVASNPGLRFERLVGVPRALVGAAGAIRGVNGGGLPWVVSRGDARLDSDGTLRVEVDGLVIDPNDPIAQARGLGGKNPSAQFEAILSCETVQNGARAVVNLATDPVDATPDGDAEIRQQLHGIPSPCMAPIVFVASPTGSWFAVSGF
jgi:hypothetical protein